ncbi:hypothetical protein Hanom_Chr06g00536731 [Helianthus anomalus]
MLSYPSLEEIRFFAQKKNMIPLFFDVDSKEVANLLAWNAKRKECKEAIEGLMKSHKCKLEANEINWRLCVSRTAGVLRGKLGRMSVAEREIDIVDEIPFPRDRFFVGREKELAEIEMAFFVNYSTRRTTLRPEGLADEEREEVGGKNGKFINFEVGNCKEQKNLVEPVIGRNSLKRTKFKKTKGFGSSIVCINGGPGMGKTELALEFAHIYSQR